MRPEDRFQLFSIPLNYHLEDKPGLIELNEMKMRTHNSVGFDNLRSAVRH